LTCAACDLAILGAGSAGLSLAAALADSAIADSLRVVVIEAHPNTPPERCFAFWATPVELDALAWPLLGQWRYWRFAERAGRQAVHDGGNARRYAAVSSLVHRQYCLQRLQQRPKFELITGVAVTDLNFDHEAVEVRADGFQLQARHVVDTRNHADRDPFPALLYQQFAGRVLQLNQPLETVRQADIMTDMSVDDYGFRFVYRLPLTSNRLLVEETRFTPRILPWRRLEEENWQAVGMFGDARPVCSERGIIPMGLCPAPQSSDPKIRRAGARGGAVRAASGYAFRRIQDWARLNARRVERHGLGALVGHPPEPRWRAAMDQLFLRVLQRYPERAPALFVDLARNAGSVALADFLSDRGGLATAARIIRAMPALLFLATALKGGRHD